MLSRTSVKCGGLNLKAKIWGDDAPQKRVLAIHGYLDNANSFDLLAPDLAQAGFQVVAIDLPGHGRSQHLGIGGRYHFLDYPGYIVEFCRGMGWNSFHLVGHSMGAAVSGMVAASFPEMVKRCVFIETLGPFNQSAAGATRHLRRAIESRLALQGKLPKVYSSFDDVVDNRLATVANWPGDQSLSRDAARRLMAGSAVSGPANAAAAAAIAATGNAAGAGDGSAAAAVSTAATTATADAGDTTPPLGPVQMTHDIRLREYSPGYLSEAAVLQTLRDIRSPTLLISGADGMPMPGAFEERRAAMADRLTQLTLPGSHHLHLDADTAAAVAAAVREFLTSEAPATLLPSLL